MVNQINEFDSTLVNVLFDIVDTFHQISLESRKVTPVGFLTKSLLLNGHPQAMRQLHLLLVLKKEALN